MDFLLLSFFCYKNYKLAKHLGERPWKWALFTLIICFSFYITGLNIYNQVSGLSMLYQDFQANPVEMIQKYFTEVMMASFFGLGSGYLGYLLLRRMLFNLYSE